jgi:hypothetical protein
LQKILLQGAASGAGGSPGKELGIRRAYSIGDYTMDEAARRILLQPSC